MTANDASQSKTKTLQQELSSLQAEVDKHTKEAKHLREQLDRSKKDSEAAMEKSKSNLSKLQQESQTLGRFDLTEYVAGYKKISVLRAK